MAETITMANRHSNLPAACRLGQTQYEPLPPMARFVFRGDEPARQTLARALGVKYPDTLRAESNDKLSLLWQGPDECLILGSAEEKDKISGMIQNAFRDLPHSLVDVSHRNVGLLLEGPDVETLLASAVQLDLSLPQFPIGMTTRTLLAKADITLWRQSAQRFHVDAWRSFSPYIFGILKEAARGL